MFFAEFAQNNKAAINENRFSQTKFQLGIMAGCSEKNIRKKRTMPPNPATPKRIVSYNRINFVVLSLIS